MTTTARSFCLLLSLVFVACAGEEGEAEAPPPVGATAPTVTYSEDVRGLVEAQCSGCHFDGGSAPFAFETYEEVAAAAPAMRAAMVAGRMPPWPADPSCRTFADERVLSSEQIAMFGSWVDQGVPEGEATAPIVISPPTFAADRTMRSATPYTPDLGSAGDDYRCFLLDRIEAPTWVTGNTVVPDTEAVHHVLVYALDPEQTAEAERRDASDAGEGYTCFGGPLPNMGDGMGMSASFPTQIAGWVPGAEPNLLPDGLGIPLEAGSRIVMQMHYSAAGGAPRPDHTALQLQLRTTPPQQVMRTVPFVVRELDIPAGESDVEVSTTFTNWSNAPVSISSFTGHMHLLGESIRADIMPASDDMACGISIPNWDFDWQLTYELTDQAPVVIAPGDRVRLTCNYDNSAENQPVVDGVQQAPRDVQWGDGSLDEMCLLYATVIEDYVAPPATMGAGACAPAQACYGATDGSLSGLLSCEEASSDCGLCAVEALQTCGQVRCLLPLANERACVTDCVVSLNAFGGSFDSCLRATCGAAYEGMLDCADPGFVSGTCDQALAACGL